VNMLSMNPATALVVPELRAVLHGRVITPDDAVYDEARTVFYGGIDRRPAAIVRAKDATDVSRVVSFARDSGLELAVRSGGHSTAGHGTTEGGIVLDLSEMKGLEIDVGRRTAWAETGLTAGEYTATAGAHGLATGFGDAGSVGIGGITLGGGIGYLVRKHGLTIDHLLAAEVVTADGDLLHADAETHPDLFWAIRGGGGNFGVATRFKLRLHEVDEIVGGTLVLPATPETITSFVAEAEAAPEDLTTIAHVMVAPPMPHLPVEAHGELVVMAMLVYAGKAEAAPEDLTTIAHVMVAPPMPHLPVEAHGELVVMAMLVYAGQAEAGELAIAPFRSLAEPLADMVKPMRYPEIYPPDDGDLHPVASARAMFLDTVDLPVAETIVEHLQASTARMAAAEIRVLGGAMAGVSADATAFAHRNSRIMVNVAAMYERPDESVVHEPWVMEFAEVLRQDDGGAYVNFLGEEGEARIRQAYPGTTWERLAAIKGRYDPTNLFHLNQNIPPGAGRTGGPAA
jgi:FAD/FMN-containing dehydrogenase